MARPRVLLTGFGPFPGAPVNPSAWLAETLAAHRASASDCEIKSRIFPTQWEAVAALTPRLFEELQPHVMIHFGLSLAARSLRIERSAYNRSRRRVDAAGALPATRTIYASGPDRLDTALSTSRIAACLRRHGFAANASRSCGGYLCNFLYYRSLAWAAGQPGSALALFVHIPNRHRQGGPFADDDLLRAAEEILRFVLAVAADASRQRLGSGTVSAPLDVEAVAAPSMAKAS